MLRSGLVPSWAEDRAIGHRLINARAETVRTTPAFRSAFKQRRCLVLADGFYEWQREGRRRRPYHFRRPDTKPFAFAGLWEAWRDRAEPEGEPAGEPLRTCALLTTRANEVVAPVHHRMPVILPPDAYGAWMDPATPAAAAHALLVPAPAGELVAYPVSARVNSPEHDDPSLVEPLAEPLAP